MNQTLSPIIFKYVANLFFIIFIFSCKNDIDKTTEISQPQNKQVEKLEAAYDKVDILTETYDFITPDEMLSKLYLLYQAWHEIALKLIKEEPILKENISKFKQIFWDLTEDIRAHLGVDKLSEENRRLSFGRPKLT